MFGEQFTIDDEIFETYNRCISCCAPRKLRPIPDSIPWAERLFMCAQCFGRNSSRRHQSPIPWTEWEGIDSQW